MKYKTYLHFLSQVASGSSGSFQHENINIYFTWNPCKATMCLSILLDDSDGSMFHGSGGCKKLKWSNDHPYFEIRDSKVFLSQDVSGIPTFVEMRSVVKGFIELSQEFNDQSMGSLPHCFR